MKHAYIILAHHAPEMLRRLVGSIDDARNDIFVHLDAKADSAPFAGICAEKSRLVWTPRVKTYWGGPSMIRAEMTAIRCARESGEYARYHLISGVDLPIKSQDYIHDYCDVQHPTSEFVGFDLNADTDPAFLDQWQRYLVLEDYTQLANPVVRKTCSLIRRSFVAIQRLVGFRRHPPFEVRKGTQWVSLTGRMVDWLLANGAPICEFLRHAHCADEKLMQTAVWNSPYRANIFDLTDEGRSSMRAMEWENGRPTTWCLSDLRRFERTDRLFARKFSDGLLT